MTATMSFLVQLYFSRWLLAAISTILYIIWKYRAYKRLAAFKGPFSTGWSEIWHTHAILTMQSHLKYKEINDRYGPIARVGPNDLVTSSPELLAHMNAVRSPYTRSSWFNAATRVEPGKDHVFSELNEEKHTKRRAQMTAGYSGKENHALESDIDHRLQELLELIRTKYLSTNTQHKQMDLGRKIQYFTLDVISTIGFGQPFGDIKADADLNDYITSGKEGLTVVALSAAFGLTPYLQWPPIARLFGPSENDKSGFGKMLATARGLIDARLTKSLDGRSDMLASFVRHGLTKDEVFTEAVLQILAGSDTTATAIRSIMLYLITHPRLYFKLQAEIDNVVASGVASAVVSDGCLRAMPYLQAVVREGLRIHPPVTDVVPKKVPKGGDTVTVDGRHYFMPSGTNVSYNAWGVHHDKAMFGEDADVFRPERWIPEEKDEQSIAKLAAMH
ncbi:putative cytochrome P450 monooxygenase [Paraphoma chrysanthemicola]|uniref:Cytochrome P450 monooxygenase n=1 Tax=Paraphoma chrysanthemicola TaxID=798071 RepID=A0A8K0W552_9PLEO|nr:putative cytochrome P450 monooxygenase [Paraphoma chrysanthemicola]